MRKTREEKGITLIALIITIIVLLILAVVAINAVTGDGIIQHATNAKTSYQNAQAKENSIIGEYMNFLNDNNPNNLNKKIITFEFYDLDEERMEDYTFGWDVLKLQAEEGMTWYEWCKSSYNTLGITCESVTSRVIGNYEKISVEFRHIKSFKDYDFVLGSDVISKDERYGSYKVVGD